MLILFLLCFYIDLYMKTYVTIASLWPAYILDSCFWHDLLLFRHVYMIRGFLHVAITYIVMCIWLRGGYWISINMQSLLCILSMLFKCIPDSFHPMLKYDHLSLAFNTYECWFLFFSLKHAPGLIPTMISYVWECYVCNPYVCDLPQI